MELFASVPLLIIDDLGMRKLPTTAAEDFWRLCCVAMSVPVRCSVRIDRWRTGAIY